jgi:hypothetical protein
MKQTVSQFVARLGACSERVEWYKRFGSDFDAALRRAPAYDVRWVLDKVWRRMSRNAYAVARLPRDCNRWCLMAHQHVIDKAKNRREMLGVFLRERAERNAKR